MIDTSRWSDIVGFLRAGLLQPRKVGALCPSSKTLAKLITQEIAPDSGPVIELGPGTGVFTSALLARGLDQAALTLVECDSGLASRLRQRFPGARILCMDAADLGREQLYEGILAGAVISGLPLLSLPQGNIGNILRAVFSHMATDAALYQFTYGLACPVPPHVMSLLGLKAVCVGRTLANIPPASVYRITQHT